MKKRMVLPLLVLLISVLIAVLVSGTVFTPTANPTTLKTNGLSQTINFTIRNDNTTSNITQVNFTLPLGITFVSGTNSTNATGWIFDSSSSSVNWTNFSSIGIINLSSSAWFAFQVNAPLVFTNVNFTVTTVDVAGVVNSTNVSITVEPDAVSNNRRFGAFPSTINLNATSNYQSNITLIVNQTMVENNITLEIFNTTGFTANYSQSNSNTQYCSSIRLSIRNSTGYGTNTTGWLINGSSTSNNTNMTLIHDTSTYSICSPGRYLINQLMIRNYTNSTENLNISVVLDIPISPSSVDYPLNISTGIGRFNGTIPTNASNYHSYLFNATSMNYTDATNITSVTINLTGWTSSQDVDMFLFDNLGRLIAKSINKTATVEWLTYNYLPTSSQMWEIRLYGNSTSTIPYSGYIIFSTLNVTNASTDQQISSIDFGASMNATNVSTVNLKLKNEGSVNLTNILENKELYYVQRSGRSGSQNISFLVPNSSIASRVKVNLNWTGSSNYSFTVYKPDGSTAMFSMNKFVYANVTNAMQEEYNETTDIGSASGYWRVDIRNNTVANDAYNVTVYVYVNASRWITSNFTNSTSGLIFNTTSLPNSSSTYIVQVNLTAQNDTLDGKYEGYLKYRASTGATMRIPIEATTKTGTLVINNSLGGSTIQIDENIGRNLTKVLNITYNNTGSYPISLTAISSGMLNLSTNTNKNMTFAYQIPSSVSAGGNGTINITININTTNTSDTQGLYEGFITFSTNDSRPYQNFTLSLRVNLTNLLIVSFNSVTPSITRNATAENVILSLTLTYMNGSELTYLNVSSLVTGNDMSAPNTTSNNPSNFSSAWLVSSNVSSFRIPTTGTLGIYNGTNPIYQSPNYNINITIPASSVGGTYEVHVLANYSRNDIKIFSGYGISSNQVKHLTINNSGLYMATNQTSFSMSGNTTARFYVNITNYGPLTSNAALNTIGFTESCSNYSVSGSTSNVQGNCSLSGTSTNPYNVSVTGNASCLVWWTITTTSSGSGSACTGNITNVGYWFNSLTPSVTVSDTASSSSTSTSTSTTTTTTNATTTTTNLEFTKAETLVFVQQNSTNTTEVEVKNTGNTTQNITFKIENISSSWYSLNATTASLAVGKTAGFKITFDVGNADVKDYLGKYNASSTSKTITKDFALRVLPAPAKQLEINDTFALLKLNATKLEEEINQSKAKGINVTLAEQKLNELKATISQAETYINQGDYFSAYQLFTDIKTLMDDTKSELAKAKAVVESGKKRFRWIIIGVGAAVIGIGVLAYMFWPTKPGYHQEKGFTQKKEESLWDNLKEKWEKIKKGK